MLLYIVDMLIAANYLHGVKEIKIMLAKDFDMKDLGVDKKILSIKIYRDKSDRKLKFSHKSYA